MPTGGKVYGFEPNMAVYHNGPYYKHLSANPGVKIIPRGLWSRQAGIYFKAAGLSSRFAEQEPVDIEGWNPVKAVSIDEFVREENIEKVDSINMDIEGAVLDALKGAAAALGRDRLQLAICIYHCKEHFFQVPLFLGSILSGYEHRLGHYTAGALETVWYGIPR
jgi:FkbM family methyltransferase